MKSIPHPAVFETDLYGVLQCSPKASPEVIDAAHKALLKMYAPRKLIDSDLRARQINEAHVILSNPIERRKYDDYRNTGRKLIGPYKLLHRVAEGGFGVTYKAQHVELGEYACIKHCSEISAEVEEIFKQETKAIWNLTHFGIPVMKDFLKLDDGSYALAMSWVEGLTIQQAVEKHGRLDPENVAWITERALNTLLFLHDHGIVHGDLKPQNIIANENTHNVTLIDFGLSLVKPSATTKSKGYTELFAPPEQMAGKTLVPGSDFYSLGMTILYALSGNYSAVQRREVPADLPDPMCGFLKKLIVRDVLHRPRSAGELFDEFKKVRHASFGRAHSGMRKFSGA